MTSTRLITSLALAIVVLAAGCGGSENPSAEVAPAAKRQARPATTNLPPGRVAFRRYLDDAQTHGAIFTVRTDATDEQQLTQPEEGWIDDHPDWSPDGRQIAYQSCAEGKPCSVWTVAADGGKPRKVRFHCRLKGDCDAGSPTWTPDGRLIVTLAEGRVRILDGEPQIQRSNLELIDLQTGAQRTILKSAGWTGDVIDAAVSPNGRKVLYTRWNSARSKPPFGKALFAVDIDGTNDHQVASWELGGGDHAVFSPRGSILFRSFEGDDGKQSDFWNVHPDGSGLKQLTHFEDGTLVLSASYSPDGAWIVHASNGVGGNADLFVMRADGSANRPLTRTQAWDSAPDWAPARR